MTTRPCQRCGASFEPTRSPHGLCPRCLLAVGLRDREELAPHQSSRAPEVSEIAPLFPELEFVGSIGEGGMGFVYRAKQRGLGRDVALKLLAREHAEEPSFAERFRREARALARLSHPGIVAIHDSGERGGWFYLLMEYVDGANLRHLMKSARVEPRQALSIVSQICAALQYSHDQGVVHRDVKPENVLVDREGRVKIADFGLARLVDRERGAFALTGSHQVMGTPHYMAPEQWEKPGAVDHRADIYALGVVFYELLTGEMPLGRFDAPSKRVEIDVRLDEVVFKALEKQPERRYQHASEVQSDVDSIARSERPRPAPSRPGAGELAHQPAAGRAFLYGLVFFVGVYLTSSALTTAFSELLHLASGGRIEFGQLLYVCLLQSALGWPCLLAAWHALRLSSPDSDVWRRGGFAGFDWATALYAALSATTVVSALVQQGGSQGWIAAAHGAVGLAVCAACAWRRWSWRRRDADSPPRGAAAPRPDDSGLPPGPQAASATRPPGQVKLFFFGLLLFLGLHLVCSGLSYAGAWAITTAQGQPSGGARSLLTLLSQAVLALPCIFGAWHLLRPSDRSSPAWTQPRYSGFDLAWSLFAAWAVFAASMGAERYAEPTPELVWIFRLQAASALPLAVLFAWRRWSWRPRARAPSLSA